jgi:acyl-CoA synthetase (AMP-forming)/AMP-acid ligase II
MEHDVDDSDALAIVYTSGSTSAPKGVVHTHASLLGHQKILNEIRGLSPDDKLFCNSPFFWIGGIAFALLATLLAGSTLVCSNATDAAETLDLIEAEKPTITNGFVAGIAHLASHPSLPDRNLSSVRRGNLYPIMAPEVRPADPELRHTMLGMTEAGSVITISEDESDQPEHRRGSFGKPAPGFETKIVDGELCIRGPYVMQRYYKASREECFDADGWFHTGDLVRTDADGFVYFIGRRGAMIKTAGANVAPAEVERAIAKVADGTVAHVIGLPDPERGQLVAAVVALEDGADFDEVAVRERLAAELSSYKIPKRFATVPRSDIPVLSSGKIDIPRLTKVFDA